MADASSGDLLADRRYAYAEAAFADGDHAAAADLAHQILDIAPGFAAAWLLLGRARAALFALAGSGPEAFGLFRDAVAALEGAKAADPADRLGAGLHLARLTGADPLAAMSAGYVTALFDDYATRFDRHLRQSLSYRGPEVLHDCVRRACSARLRPMAFARALDLGCGTGLAGELFRGECRTLAGIDLSPAMLRKAAGKRLYDELAVADLTRWLDGQPDGSADLALAVDVLVYLGEMRPLFATLARVLMPGGLFAFTVQEPPDGTDDPALGEDHRFAHPAGYVLARAGEAGLAVLSSEAVTTRQDRGQDVPGRAFVLERR